MFKFCIMFIFLLFITPSLQDFINISSRARLVDGNQYLAKIMQETFVAVEKRGFCNLKVYDFNQTLNEAMYNWNVTGRVDYTNGFLWTTDRIRVSQISSSLGTWGGQTTASFGATIEFVPAVVGYDVAAYLDSDGVHYFTGTYRHPHIRYKCQILKNMTTGEVTGTMLVDSVGSGSGLTMIYMPESKVSEVLSRRFSPSSTMDSVSSWARNIFIPLILEKAQHIDFPKIHFI